MSWSTWSIARCHKAGAEASPKTSRLYCRSPFCVLMVRNFDSSLPSGGMLGLSLACWIVSFLRVTEKCLQMRGSGYCSGCSTGLIVTLKSPQILTAPFFFTTGTIGVAHSLQLTFVIIPISSRHSSSLPTLSLTYGTCRALWKWGFASGV